MLVLVNGATAFFTTEVCSVAEAEKNCQGDLFNSIRSFLGSDSRASVLASGDLERIIMIEW